MIHHSVFPTLISEIPNFINDNELKKIKNVIQKNVKSLKHHETFNKNNNAKSSHNDNSYFLELIPFLKEKIYRITKEYVKQSGFKVSNEIGNSWFNIQKKDSVLNKHTHPSSIISGALFIKTDSKSSKLFFYNPNPMINFTTINVRNNYNYEWIYITPKPKTLILFPSWLQHGSNNTLNKSLQRIVVSFNYL